MIRFFLPLLAGALLTGCASLPQETLPPRDRVDAFSLEARFALRISAADQPAQSSSGRLSWQHQNGADRILVATPLGYGVAEIDATPTLSRLRTANGEIRESADAEALLAEVTGQHLPVSRLPAWLLGRSPAIRRDHDGRPQALDEAGWQIDYSYDNDAADALPSMLTLRRAPDIELRLRIEEWRTP